MKPYTYLIGWSKHNLWYYGVRYSQKSTPEDLWKSYFTSSVVVKRVRTMLGDPDVIQVRKTFLSGSQAKAWEEKVLRRMDTYHQVNWLNQSKPNQFKGSTDPWNKGLNKQTNHLIALTGLKIKEAIDDKKRRGIKPKGNTKPKTKAEGDADSWRQLYNKLSSRFSDYQSFRKHVQNEYYQNGKGPQTIATELGIDLSATKKILGASSADSSWTKIRKRYPNFKFKTYSEFSDYCKSFSASGRGFKAKLIRELGLNESTINRALSFQPATSNH